MQLDVPAIPLARVFEKLADNRIRIVI